MKIAPIFFAPVLCPNRLSVFGIAEPVINHVRSSWYFGFARNDEIQFGTVFNDCSIPDPHPVSQANAAWRPVS